MPKPAKKPARRRTARRTSKATTPTVVTVRASAMDFAMGQAVSTSIGPEVAVRVTSILAVVRWIAQAVATMPVQVMRTLPDGRKVDAAVPAGYVLKKRPNSWQTAYDFYQLIAYWTALHGNAFARIIPGDRGWMSELRPMHPTRVDVIRNRDYSLSYRFFDETRTWRDLDASEVLHWRWLSDNGFYGLPPTELCGTSLGLARRLDAAATAHWDNSGRPDLVLETDEKIPDEAVHALRAALHDVYGGARNRGKTAVLPKKTRLKAIESNTMEQSQFQELRDAILADICRCWGVPSTLLGDHRMARWSNMEQEHLSAQVWSLLPWQRRIEGPIDMAIQPVYGEDVYCKLDNRGLLRADSSSRVALYQALWNMGAITPNELRDLEDLPLLDTESANQTFVQLGFSTLDNAAAAASDPSGDQPEPMPAELPATPADAPSVAGVDLQATALNGAQVTALLEVLAQVSAGALEQDAAVALITSAFPTVSEDLARQMVAGANQVEPPQQGGPTDG